MPPSKPKPAATMAERVRRLRIEELKVLLGSVRLEIDLSNSRRRP